jgi:DNA-binding GntR family transcriptional regulator
MADENGDGVKGTVAKAVVATGLRERILAGEMSPGQRLVEAELVEMFGAPRASVRAAMDDLAVEGLIEKVPNKGARVRVVSLEEAVAILECRSVLEGLIAARAAERVSGDQAEQLEQIAREMQAAVRDGEVMTYSQLNARLHALVAEISGQRTAAELIVRLRSQIVRHQFQLSMRPGRPQVSLGQHLAIISGVVAKDPARAEAAARAHVDSVIDALTSGGIGK